LALVGSLEDLLLLCLGDGRNNSDHDLTHCAFGTDAIIEKPERYAQFHLKGGFHSFKHMNTSEARMRYVLCFDDSGSRDPDKRMSLQNRRQDNMDWFALGGILVKEEDISEIIEKHRDFCKKWSIDYPLHSTKIRGHQGKFAWLKKPENRECFYPELENFLLSLPVICTACVMHRPGYVARYKEQYEDRLWLMCKTTFSILTERASKYADTQGRQLEIIFEESGKKEDRDIVRYAKDLKKRGNPFNRLTSQEYQPLMAEDYRRIVIGEPRRKKKTNPLLQVADLLLFPLAKSGYDLEYRPYKTLKEHGKIIDCKLAEKDLPVMAMKYSCFDGP